jgi:hypothetical protein
VSRGQRNGSHLEVREQKRLNTTVVNYPFTSMYGTNSSVPFQHDVSRVTNGTHNHLKVMKETLTVTVSTYKGLGATSYLIRELEKIACAHPELRWTLLTIFKLILQHRTSLRCRPKERIMTFSLLVI